MQKSTDVNKAKYAPPQVTVWGAVADITEVGMTNPGGDSRGGSVIPGNPDAGTPGGPGGGGPGGGGGRL